MTSRPHSVEVPYGWVVIIASLVIHSIGLAAPNILFVALKPIAADLDTVRAVPSFAYALLMVGSGVGGIAMGMWMDRRGVMQPVMFGATMIGLGALLASQSEGRWSLYVANGLLIGLLGKAAMIAPLIANATRWFDRRRGLAVAIIASGQGVAGTLWPPVVHYLNDTVGWRDTYFYFGWFALATMVPLALLLRPRPPTPPPLPPRETAGAGVGGPSAREIAGDDGLGPLAHGRSPRLLQAMLWVAVVGCCTAMAMPIVHLISHATDLGHTPTSAAQMLALLFAAAFVSRIAFGMLADRIGATQTLLIGSASQAAALLVLAYVDSAAGLYAAAAMFGLGFAGIMPCYALVIRLVFPAEQAGWRIATQYLFGAAGMALGGWLGGVMYDLYGSYTHAFLVGFGFNVVNFVTVAALHLRIRNVTPGRVALASR